MDDHTFFDHIFQLLTKTTGAENTYWMPEKNEDDSENFGEDMYDILAVSQDESRKLIASYLTEADADFITAVHGCMADLVRRMHTALDEADRLDSERDELVCRVAELELENDFLKTFVTVEEQ